MLTLDAIFLAFGGPTRLAKAIGYTTEPTAAFLRRGSIPVRFWAALVAEAKRRADAGESEFRQITLETLTELHARSREARRAPEGERYVGRRGAPPRAVQAQRSDLDQIVDAISRGIAVRVFVRPPRGREPWRVRRLKAHEGRQVRLTPETSHAVV